MIWILVTSGKKTHLVKLWSETFVRQQTEGQASPRSIEGSIVKLHELHLAHTNLSGPIPELLGNSTSLLALIYPSIIIQGEVPKEGVFKNLTGLSICGNNELRGGIPQLHLPQYPDSPARKNKKAMSLSLRIAALTTGAILVLFSGLALAAFLCRRSKAAVKN